MLPAVSQDLPEHLEKSLFPCFILSAFIIRKISKVSSLDPVHLIQISHKFLPYPVHILLPYLLHHL